MKVKSLFLVVLAAVLIAPAAVMASGSQAPGSSSKTVQTASDPNLNPVGTLPAVKNKESFSLLVDADYEASSYLMLQALEKTTNIHVDLINYPYAAALERMNILLATGDYPDAIAGWLLSDNNILTLSADGTIIPLEDIIDTQTVNVKQALNIQGVRASMTLPDGHIYSPPYVIGEPEVTFNPFINTKWLAQVGLKMPTTTDELKTALIAFRDKIGTVNGQKVIPFSGDPVNMDLGVFAGWFGQTAPASGVNGGYFSLINGVVEFTATRPEYRSVIKYFADLWKEGLIDQELFTQDQTTWKAKGKQGIYGMSVAYGTGDFQDEPPGLTPEQKAVRYFDYEPLPVLKAPGVTKPNYRRNSYGVTLFRTQFAITDKAKNPITILRWLDEVFTAENSISCDAGLVGTSWEWVEKNKTWRGIDLEAKGWSKEERDKYGWSRYWPASLPKFKRTDIKEVPKAGQPAVYDEIAVRDALYAPYLDERLPNTWLSGDDAKKVADLQTAISDYVKQKQAEWISGQANIDTEWNAYVAQLDRLGLQDLIRLKRAAVAATQK